MTDFHVPVRESTRAKRMSLVVHWNGRCELVVPKTHPPSQRQMRRFLLQQREWLTRQVNRVRRRGDRIAITHQGVPTARVEENTHALVHRLFQTHIPSNEWQYPEIRVRAFKSQWGSCTRSGRLSFHYKLSLLPEKLAEYVVVHELAHLQEFNHSKAFWHIVARILPDYKDRRKQLRQYLL